MRFTTWPSFSTTPFASGTVLPPVGMPGGMMVISANGSAPGSGIVRATTPRAGDANQKVVPGILYAFNAETLGAPIWKSTGVGDDIYNFAKGSPPLAVNGKVYVASLSNIVSVFGLRSIPPSQNLALNKSATGSTPCTFSETPDTAVNGTYSGGLSDKFCSHSIPSFLQVDLGFNWTINQIVVEHAGAGGESSVDGQAAQIFELSTKDYNLEVSTDGIKFARVATMTGNIQSITTHNITQPTTARYVRLNVTIPSQTADTATRIYELQVYGTNQ